MDTKDNTVHEQSFPADKPRKKNPHEGHRNRLREKFFKGGLDSFEEHEVLEMLLYDCIPMRNTNELAHELIDYYGSLSQVFEAHCDELRKFKGMTAAAASCIAQYAPVQRFVERNRLKNLTILKNLGQAKSYFHTLLRDARREEFYLVCLGPRLEVLYRIKIREGTPNRVTVDIREIADVICRHRAASIAVAHSHPSGDPVPSINDDDFTRNLFIAMDLLDVKLLDHIIVGEEKLYSYYEQNRFAEFEKDLSLATKVPYSRTSVMLAQNKYLSDFYKNTEEEEYEYKII